jgi:hypothetical protein
MRVRLINLACVAIVFTFASGPISGQVASSAPAASGLPRTPQGKPDFGGFWQVMNSANWDIQDHHAQEPGMPAGQGVVEGNEIPYQPAAAAKKKENYEKRKTADPETKCYLPGVPRITYMPYPFQIVQMPDHIAILYEYVHAVRNVFMNTPHPEGPIDWWMGDSRGKWDGDTLVIDVVHFDDRTWFDRAGNHHSDALHVVERYSYQDRDHINYEVTIEDPKVFTRPWKMSMVLYRHKEKNFQLLEYECYAFDNLFSAKPLD